MPAKRFLPLVVAGLLFSAAHAAIAAPSMTIPQPPPLNCPPDLVDKETVTVSGGTFSVAGAATYGGSNGPGTATFTIAGPVTDVVMGGVHPSCSNNSTIYHYVHIDGSLLFNFRGSGPPLQDATNRPQTSTELRYFDAAGAKNALVALRCAALQVGCGQQQQGGTYQDYFDKTVTFSGSSGCTYKVHIQAFASVTVPNNPATLHDGDTATVSIELHPDPPVFAGDASAAASCPAPVTSAESVTGTAIVNGGAITYQGTTQPAGRYAVTFSGSLGTALIGADLNIADVALPGSSTAHMAGILSKASGVDTAPAGWDQPNVVGNCVNGFSAGAGGTAPCNGTPVAPIAPLSTDLPTTISMLQSRLQQFEAEWRQNGPTFAIMRQVLLSIDPNATPDQQALRKALLSLLDSAEQAQTQYQALQHATALTPQTTSAFQKFGATVTHVSTTQRTVAQSPTYRTAAVAAVKSAISVANAPPRPAAAQAARPQPTATANQCTPDMRSAYETMKQLMPTLQAQGGPSVPQLQQTMAEFAARCGN